jgi:hypothetical protein
MWNNIVDPDRPQITTWRMCIEYCISGYTHSEYVTLVAGENSCNSGERTCVLAVRYEAYGL